MPCNTNNRFLYPVFAVLLSVMNFTICSAGDSGQSELKVSAGVNIRLRNELWDTFSRQAASTDNTYDFFLTRSRGFADISWKNLTFHTMVQFVTGFNFPENGAFGPGPTYFVASGNDDYPVELQLAEFSLGLKDIPFQGLYLQGGRIGINDGAEILYGDPKIDWIKKNRLSERLIGTFDWVNIGRRYDGGIAGYGNKIFDLNLFGARVLQGGFDFDDAFEGLDNVVVTGGTLTLKKDSVIPSTEIRVFNYYYFDDRTPAIDVAGDDLKINTTGASMVGAFKEGPGQLDLLLWFAFQLGKFGDDDQKALGFIGEIGYQFLEALWKPWIRLGFAYASGDGDTSDSDNETFFNLVPTNHKYYGYVDALAFSNLQDYYFQFILTPHQKIAFAIDGHYFRLASDDEFWIGGSGAFNNKAFGYIFFRPVEGNDIEKNLGGELDLTLTLKPFQYLSFEIGYSHFFGGNGVGAVFDEEDQLNWFYAQAVINFSK